jgi:hypothetical protein
MTWANDLREENPDQPTPQGTEWDYVIFAGDVCPGIASVDITSPDGLDKKKAKGKRKATISDNGDNPLEIDIDLILLPADLEYFREVTLPTLRPRTRTGAREPLSFGHPMAEFWGVQNIIVGTIKSGHPSRGQMRVNIKAYEWSPKVSEAISTGKVQVSPRKIYAPLSGILPTITDGIPVPLLDVVD